MSKNIDYHVQKNEYVGHKHVKSYCTTNQFTKLPFCGWHIKPNSSHRLVNNYHMRFDPKLGCDTCAIQCINFACTQFTSILDKPWYPGVSQYQQPCYQPVIYFTYWPVLGSFNSSYKINFRDKKQSNEDIEELIRSY